MANKCNLLDAFGRAALKIKVDFIWQELKLKLEAFSEDHGIYPDLGKSIRVQKEKKRINIKPTSFERIA